MTPSHVIRAALPQDATRIAPLLRETDRLEVEAISGESPEALLPRAFTGKPSGTVVFAETAKGKEPILIGGIRPTDRAETSAAIWMVGTLLLDRYGFQLGREARRFVNEWHKLHPRLWNVAWEGNALHVRWLQFLGFTITGRFQHRGLPFITFERHHTHVC